MDMVADMSQHNWTPTKDVREFHLHVTEAAVARFRERSDHEHRNCSNRDIALVIDQRVSRAMSEHEAKNPHPQDIIDTTLPPFPSQDARLVVISTRQNHSVYAVLRQYRPNQYPALHLAGGPAGPGWAVVNLVALETGAENFQRGIWKRPFNRPFAEQLPTLLQVTSVQDAPTALPPAPLPKMMDAWRQLITQPQTPVDAAGDVTMDAEQTTQPTPFQIPGSNAAKERMAKVRAGKHAKPVENNKKGRQMSTTKAGGKGRPPGFKSPEKTQERINFAKAQFAIRPFMSIAGPDGLRTMMQTRFGISLSVEILKQLQSQAQKASGLTGITAIGRLKVDGRTGQPLNAKGRDKTTPVFVSRKTATPGVGTGRGNARPRRQYTDDIKVDYIRKFQAVAGTQSRGAFCAQYELTDSLFAKWLQDKELLKLAKKPASGPRVWPGPTQVPTSAPSWSWTTGVLIPTGKEDRKPKLPPRVKLAPTGDLAALGKELFDAIAAENVAKGDLDAAQELVDTANAHYLEAQGTVTAILSQMQAARS